MARQLTLAGIGQTVPNEPGTEMILESTGNGLGNKFHKMWVEAVRGESEYIAIFVPWFWEDGYSTEPPEGFTLEGVLPALNRRAVDFIRSRAAPFSDSRKSSTLLYSFVAACIALALYLTGVGLPGLLGLLAFGGLATTPPAASSTCGDAATVLCK